MQSMIKTIKVFARAMRVNQWIKNLLVFTAVIFSGKLFDLWTLGQAIIAFSIFCLLSSTSYLLNDIIDYPYDKKHPVKRYRPIASGEISMQQATFTVFILTIFFISLFMATVKRHAELITHGRETRESLYRYQEHFLEFLTTTFAPSTIIAYATYTYVEKIPQVNTIFTPIMSQYLPGFEARKWMMVTIPLVVYGISRYAQLLYEKVEGERPEKIITKDLPLVATIISWVSVIILLMYVL